MEVTRMQRKRAADFDQELLNLFDQYVHGAIDRRRVGVWNPWQHHGVGADGWHDRSLSWTEAHPFPRSKDTCIRNIPDERLPSCHLGATTRSVRNCWRCWASPPGPVLREPWGLKGPFTWENALRRSQRTG